jgi:hypothetical protein
MGYRTPERRVIGDGDEDPVPSVPTSDKSFQSTDVLDDVISTHVLGAVVLQRELLTIDLA